MFHAIYDVTWFEQLGTYTLRVGPDDGTSQEIDFEPVLHGELLARSATRRCSPG